MVGGCPKALGTRVKVRSFWAVRTVGLRRSDEPAQRRGRPLVWTGRRQMGRSKVQGTMVRDLWVIPGVCVVIFAHVKNGTAVRPQGPG